MRGWKCVPMIALCLLLTACGGAGEKQGAADLRDRYHDMTGCSMEAAVTCPAETESKRPGTLRRPTAVRWC